MSEGSDNVATLVKCLSTVSVGNEPLL